MFNKASQVRCNKILNYNMCWNQYVSINTFIFGIFGLCLIAFNNNNSVYKLPVFNNPYMYIFFLSFILMQGIEFVLWRNLQNMTINKIFSTLGLLLLVVQPISSLYLLSNIPLRNKMLWFYSIPAILFFIYNVFHTNITTKLSPRHHLEWKWTSYSNPVVDILIKCYYLFFLFFALIYNKYYSSLFFLFLFVLFTYYLNKDGSVGSIWCLSINLAVLYYMIQILVVMPYNEIVSLNI